MTPFARVAHAMRRIATASSVRLVRGEDAEREARHGGPLSELTDRAAQHAVDLERQARRLET